MCRTWSSADSRRYRKGQAVDKPNKQQKMEGWIARHIKQPPHVLYDIGVGPKTEAQTLRALYPKMLIYGCEPLMYEYPGLRQSFPGKLLDVAISDEHGRVTLHYNPDNLLDSSAIHHLDGQTATKTAEAWTLDMFDQWFGCPKRILLWMDIEGMELTALYGAEKLLKSHRVRWINIEERRQDLDGWPRAEDIRQLLAEYGYIRLQEYNKHPLHQDVIYIYEGEK